jgi:tRNA pseudouridine38-40 synthase
MVRNIVGTLFEVGYGRMTVADFATVFKARDRNLAGPTAPACGLFLKKVYYEKPAEFSCRSC